MNTIIIFGVFLRGFRWSSLTYIINYCNLTIVAKIRKLSHPPIHAYVINPLFLWVFFMSQISRLNCFSSFT